VIVYLPSKPSLAVLQGEKGEVHTHQTSSSWNNTNTRKVHDPNKATTKMSSSNDKIKNQTNMHNLNTNNLNSNSKNTSINTPLTTSPLPKLQPRKIPIIRSLAQTHQHPSPPTTLEKAKAKEAHLEAQEQKALEEEAYAKLVAFATSYNPAYRGNECLKELTWEKPEPMEL
jgi:hypothetical protein